jgi:malate dehydrogenase
VKSGRRPLEL